MTEKIDLIERQNAAAVAALLGNTGVTHTVDQAEQQIAASESRFTSYVDRDAAVKTYNNRHGFNYPNSSDREPYGKTPDKYSAKSKEIAGLVGEQAEAIDAEIAELQPLFGELAERFLPGIVEDNHSREIFDRPDSPSVKLASLYKARAVDFMAGGAVNELFDGKDAANMSVDDADRLVKEMQSAANVARFPYSAVRNHFKLAGMDERDAVRRYGED